MALKHSSRFTSLTINEKLKHGSHCWSHSRQGPSLLERGSEKKRSGQRRLACIRACPMAQRHAPLTSGSLPSKGSWSRFPQYEAVFAHVREANSFPFWETFPQMRNKATTSEPRGFNAFYFNANCVTSFLILCSCSNYLRVPPCSN